MVNKITGGALLKKVEEHVRKGMYVLASHAIKRQLERQVSLPEVLYVLKHGTHEERNDGFDTKRQLWKYAVRGRTLHGIELRIIISFEEEMVIITVMRLRE